MGGVADTQPAWQTKTLAKNDTTKITDNNGTQKVTRAILVIVGGAVKVGFPDGTDDTYTNLPAGWHPLRIDRLFLNGTDASVEIHGAF